MKKLLLLFIFISLAGCTQDIKNFGAAIPVFRPTQGGTGIGSAVAGDIGKSLVVSNNSPFTYTLNTVGGGGAAWERIFTSPNAMRPTDTTAGLYVNSASSTFNGLRVDGNFSAKNASTTETHSFGTDGAGDAAIEFYDTNVSAFSLGNDDSANLFTLSSGGVLGTSNLLTFSSSGNSTTTAHVTFSGLETATGGTNNDVCISATGQLINESTGTCIVSSRKFKHNIEPLGISGLEIINSLKPSSFVRNGEDSTRYGLIAEEVAEVDSRLATYGLDGLPRGLDDHALLAILVKAVQELTSKQCRQ